MRIFGKCLTSNDITLRHDLCDVLSFHIRHLTRREMYKFGGPFFEHRQTIQCCFKHLPGSFYSNARKFTSHKEKMPNIRTTHKKHEQWRRNSGLGKSKLTQEKEPRQTEIELLRAENARLTERCLLLTEKTTRLWEDYSQCIKDHAETLEQL